MVNNTTRLCLILYDHIFEMRTRFRNNEVRDADKELFELFEKIWNDQLEILSKWIKNG